MVEEDPMNFVADAEAHLRSIVEDLKKENEKLLKENKKLKKELEGKNGKK